MKKVSVINEISTDEPILRKFKKDGRLIRQWIEVPLHLEEKEIEIKVKGSMTVIQREDDTFALGISTVDGFEELEKIIQKKAEELKPQVIKKHRPFGKYRGTDFCLIKEYENHSKIWVKMYESQGKINAEFVKRNPKTNLWEKFNPENIVKIQISKSCLFYSISTLY